MIQINVIATIIAFNHPAHLLLSCSKYAAEYSKIKDKLKASNLSLKLLLTTRDEIQAVFDFLKDSEIVRRN
jgi:hypothetical protein